MPTRSDAPDLAVDELKRRARRRLVGAIVLALAAAVILPFLLESDPKPLGDEVSIRIPPIDDGKFVNPLAPGRGSDSKVPGAIDPKGEAKSSTVITPKKSITEAERRVLGQSPAQPAPSAASTPATIPLPPPVDVPASAAATTDTPATKTDVAIATPTPPAAATGAYAVQVGAFADAKVADELVATLKSSGFATYIEAVPTAQGSVQRVRVGPFATRAAADAAVAKLKLAGHDRAMVTNTK
jgi:DedD protein